MTPGKKEILEPVSSAGHESVHVFPFFLRYTEVSGGLCGEETDEQTTDSLPLRVPRNYSPLKELP